LTIDQIEDPGVRVKVQDQISFLNLAADALQDDLLGFHLALSCDLREFGLLYYVSASSATLGEALQRAARYSIIAHEGVCITYPDRNDVHVTFNYVGVSRHTDRHQIEFFLTLLVRMAGHLTGQRVVPTDVRLIHARDRLNPELSEFFGCDLQFRASVYEVV